MKLDGCSYCRALEDEVADSRRKIEAFQRSQTDVIAILAEEKYKVNSLVQKYVQQTFDRCQ